jgi:hypothetical protein
LQQMKIATLPPEPDAPAVRRESEGLGAFMPTSFINDAKLAEQMSDETRCCVG